MSATFKANGNQNVYFRALDGQSLLNNHSSLNGCNRAEVEEESNNTR